MGAEPSRGAVVRLIHWLGRISRERWLTGHQWNRDGGHLVSAHGPQHAP